MATSSYLGATQLVLGTLGASVFPTLVKPPANCVGGQMRMLGAAGSTVQILPNTIAGLNIAGATAIVGGYPIYPTGTNNTDFYWDGPNAFYLAATGATATVAIVFQLSAGATLA